MTNLELIQNYSLLNQVIVFTIPKFQDEAYYQGKKIFCGEAFKLADLNRIAEEKPYLNINAEYILTIELSDQDKIRFYTSGSFPKLEDLNQEWLEEQFESLGFYLF